MATAGFENETGISSDDLEGHLHCQPCEEEGKLLRKVGYCVNCREYLCQRCFDAHLIPSVTRKHILLDKDQISEGDNTHHCQQHIDRDIEYHCPTHAFLGCHICFFQHQKSCKETVCISDFVSTTAFTDKLDRLSQSLDTIIDKCNITNLKITTEQAAIEADSEKAIREINAFKEEIINTVKKHGEQLVDEACTFKRDEIAKINDKSRKCENMMKDALKLNSTVRVMKIKEKTCDLYNGYLNVEESAKRFIIYLQDINDGMQTHPIEYRINKDLSKTIHSPFGLGSLTLKGAVEKVENIRDFNCKSGKDVTNCCITGMVSLPGQMFIAADWGEGKQTTLKLFDMKTYKIQSDLKLSSSPYNVCKITDNLVAVTLPFEKKIVFVKSDPFLSIEQEICLTRQPGGIGYFDGKLVVSYKNKNLVEIMDMQKAYTKTFTIDEDCNGKPLFNAPYHLAINPRNKLIYVSNFKDNNVVCMDFTGKVIGTYEDNDLKEPRQVTFDNSGMVYVCGEGSHNVHQFTEDCEKAKILLTCNDGLKGPISILYDENEETLLISQWNNDMMKIYQMSCQNL